jgi:hypothetical protein
MTYATWNNSPNLMILLKVVPVFSLILIQFGQLTVHGIAPIGYAGLHPGEHVDVKS